MHGIKKMALVDTSMLDRLNSSEALSTRTEEARKTLSDLDMGIKNVSDRDDLTDEQKVRLYTTALQKFVQVRNRMDPIQPIIQKDTSHQKESNMFPAAAESKALHAIPPIYRNRAEKILQHINTSSDVGWSENGRLIYQDNIVEGSNIADLLFDVVKSGSRTKNPEGWREFAAALKEVNVPRSFIGNTARWHHISTSSPGHLQVMEDVESDTGSDDEEEYSFASESMQEGSGKGHKRKHSGRPSKGRGKHHQVIKCWLHY